MRQKEKKAAYQPPVVKTVKEDPIAVIQREIARIQKKLGMDFSWYKA